MHLRTSITGFEYAKDFGNLQCVRLGRQQGRGASGFGKTSVSGEVGITRQEHEDWKGLVCLDFDVC